MKILVIGGGGREHAIVWKLRQSAGVEKIWCAPGNGGVEKDAECVPLDIGDVKAAADLATKLGADLTICGPELPLVRGIADEFAKRGLALLGPSQEAAKLEGSKVFAKKFMERHGIPTATAYGIYDSPIDAYTSICSVDWPLVVKADGLCAGKGVLVTSSPDEASEFIDRLMEKKEFGDAGRQVLLEEGLAGRELSYIILSDGKNFVSLAPARDHKRAFDNDEGPNTGGMGTFSTPDILSPELEAQILNSVVEPTLAGLQKDGLTYRGFLYFGLMLTSEGPKVLEYNCRLGDPETQAILLRADCDFADACARAAARRAVFAADKIIERRKRLHCRGVRGLSGRPENRKRSRGVGCGFESIGRRNLSRWNATRRREIVHNRRTRSQRGRDGRESSRGLQDCVRSGKQDQNRRSALSEGHRETQRCEQGRGGAQWVR